MRFLSSPDIQKGSVEHPASDPMCTEQDIPECKAAEAWNRQFASIYCQGK